MSLRYTAANSMARIGAVRALEEIGEEDAARHGRSQQQTQPGVVIRVLNIVAPPAEPTSPTIDITPAPTLDEPPAYPDPRLRRS
mgnify:CR=1 FL=1